MFASIAKTLRLEILTSTHWHRLGREFFWVGLGQFIAAIGAIVGVRLLTHALPPATYGELSLGLTAATLVQQMLLGPLAGASLRFFSPAQEAKQLRAYVQGVQQLIIQATLILLGFAVLFSVGLWLSGNSQWLGLTLAALIFALFSGYSSALDGMQNAARQRAIVAWHAGLAVWLRFLIAVGLTHIIGASSQVAMIGFALASAFIIASQFWFFRHRIFVLSDTEPPAALTQSRQWVKQMLSYAWPFAAWGLFSWAQFVSDRWALQIFTSTREVGLYAVLFQLGYYPITLLSSLVMQLVTPVFFQRAGDASDAGRVQRVYAANWQLVFASLGLAFLGTIAAAALHRVVFHWLTATEYQSISWMLPGVVLSAGLFAAGQFASVSLMSGAETQNLLAPKIFTAILGTGANFIGAAWLGLPGVVGAGIVFSCCYFLWIIYLLTVRRNRMAVSTD